MKLKPLFILILLWSIGLQAQELPTIINIRENDKILEQLSTEYKGSLFSASGMDINATSNNWKHMLTAMEAYAEEIKFDLKGVQVWFKVFWDKNGKIDYITYFLMEKSINIDRFELEAFFKSFVNRYELPVSYRTKFAYDARVQFPVYMMR